MTFKMDLETYQRKLDLTNIPSNPQDRFNYCRAKILSYYNRRRTNGILISIIASIHLFGVFISGIAMVYDREIMGIFPIIISIYIILNPHTYTGPRLPIIWNPDADTWLKIPVQLKKLTEPESIFTFNSKVKDRQFKKIKAKYILAGLISEKMASDYNEFIGRLDASEEEWNEFRNQKLVPDLVPIDN